MENKRGECVQSKGAHFGYVDAFRKKIWLGEEVGWIDLYRFQCDRCGSELRIDDSPNLRSVRCKNCRRHFLPEHFKNTNTDVKPTAVIPSMESADFGNSPGSVFKEYVDQVNGMIRDAIVGTNDEVRFTIGNMEFTVHKDLGYLKDFKIDGRSIGVRTVSLHLDFKDIPRVDIGTIAVKKDAKLPPPR